jgi:mitogen-activated protein kinase kinase
VWSSGLTLLELAMGRFPYPDDLDNPIELMSFIIRGEVRRTRSFVLGKIPTTLYVKIPQLQDEGSVIWSDEVKDFVRLRSGSLRRSSAGTHTLHSLTVSPQDRPTPSVMLEHEWLKQHAYLKMTMMQRWIREVWGWPRPLR